MALNNNETIPLMASSQNTINVEDDDKSSNDLSCCTSTVFNSDVFFDAKKGWIQYFDPIMNIKQLFIRNREGAFYAFDAFRALAFLWVSNSHLIEGLEIPFNDFDDWTATQNRSFASISHQGITVFFTISGFLNFFVALRIAQSLKAQGMTFRVIRNFLFRRYMHLAPNLYLIVPVAMIIGYYNTNAKQVSLFYSHCLGTWWTNIIFIENFAGIIDNECFNSVWTISTEMQFYLCSVPILFIYSWNKIMGALFVVFLILLVFLYRNLIIMYHVDGWLSLVYFTPMGRFDGYGLGILLYMFYQNIVKPIKTRSYYHGHDASHNHDSSSSSGSSGAIDTNNHHIPTAADNTIIHNLNTTTSTTTTEGLPTQDPSTASASSDTGNGNNSSSNAQDKDNDDIYYQFKAFLYDNIILSTHNYYTEKSSQLHFLHSHAPLYMIISIYAAWIFAIVMITLGFIYIFFEPDYFFYDWYTTSCTSSTCSTYESDSYGYFVVAGATVSLLFICIEGSTVSIIPYIFNQYFWYPLGNLTYTGYLLSIIVTMNFGSVILRYNNNEQVSWVDLNYGLGMYFGMYVGVVSLNLVLAMIFSVLVERPFMNIGKAVIFNNLWEDDVHSD